MSDSLGTTSISTLREEIPLHCPALQKFLICLPLKEAGSVRPPASPITLVFGWATCQTPPISLQSSGQDHSRSKARLRCQWVPTASLQ